ncbi:peptidase dimerization domain-containing protein [Streptomyces sp. NPDC048550]|uniref:peptidase dimerization domain-containing protein n=1 Tax=unclassified Streptomyces TaxID=2593676 RepID=UPI003413DB44
MHDWSWAPLTAQTQVRIGFHDRAAHPTGDPTRGIDALAALIQLFNTAAVVSRRLPPGSHVQGLVTDGGSATNIVPAYAEGLFGLRAATSTALYKLAADIGGWAEGGAAATGTTVEVSRLGKGYAHFRDNDVLSDRFGLHIARSGIHLTEPVGGVFLGSSDIGAVSHLAPAIHPFVAILGDDASDHSRFPTRCGLRARPRGDAGCRRGPRLHGGRRPHRPRAHRSGVGPSVGTGGSRPMACGPERYPPLARTGSGTHATASGCRTGRGHTPCNEGSCRPNARCGGIRVRAP